MKKCKNLAAMMTMADEYKLWLQGDKHPRALHGQLLVKWVDMRKLAHMQLLAHWYIVGPKLLEMLKMCRLQTELDGSSVMLNKRIENVIEEAEVV